MAKAQSDQVVVSEPPTSLEQAADRLRIEADSDDDDDLDPIESIGVPATANGVTYVRDFLDGEFKTFDEMSAALKALPDVMRHQLPLEHEEVAVEVLDRIFRSVHLGILFFP